MQHIFSRSSRAFAMCIVLTSHKYPKGGPDRKRERCKVRRTRPFDIPHVRSISLHRVISTESCIALLHKTCFTTRRCPITRAATHVAALLYTCRGKVYLMRLWASIDLRSVFYFVINSVARVEQPVSDSCVCVLDLLISYSSTVHKSERKIRERGSTNISINFILSRMLAKFSRFSSISNAHLAM